MSGDAADLKRVVGAMIFAATRPLSLAGMRRCLEAAAEAGDPAAKALAGAKESDIAAAVEALTVELDRAGAGFVIREVAGGFRLESDPACGLWLKHLLDAGRPNRLSMPALETLAIVACRQPVTRAQIETVRGVSVDHVMRTLMEMQLVKIVGRSELPGRPFQYGTTQLFLEHFGLRGLDELKSADMLREREAERDAETGPAGAAAAGAESGTENTPEDAPEDAS
ncbi:MAG: SMC-Scp complex subunit ScpB [Lentisphaerae bacterium]|nr:SMC-Scp complex subunit ScpB [Lentisphaerota bacterium]